MQINLLWYHRAVERAERRAGRAGWFCVCIIAMHIYSFVAFVEELVSNIQDANRIEVAASIGLALLWLGGVCRIALRYFHLNRQRQLQIDEGNTYRAPVDAIIGIRDDVRKFSELLFLPKYAVDFEIWICRSGGLSPSVFELGRNVCLCLPLGFIALFRKNRTCARAILAHELSHVAQGDAILWRLSYIIDIPLYRLSSVLLWSGIAVGVLHFLRAISMWSFPGGLPVVVLPIAAFGILIKLMLLILISRMKRTLLSARHASEMLADLGSALCIGLEGCCCAIMEIADNVESTLMHPAQGERVRILRALFESEKHQSHIRIRMGNLFI
jgi:hypothetical protein